MKLLPFFLWIWLLFIGVHARAELHADVEKIQTGWAEANYQLAGKRQQEAFEALIAEADAVTRAHPDIADAWVWSGIVKSTYAGIASPLSAMKYAKAARSDLEKAIAINGNALNGAAYTSLGVLYAHVPGWPIGFGDDDKAEQLLKKGLAIAPDDIDSNYFYGQFLAEHHKADAARAYLQKAQQASPRAGRQVADLGRQGDISELLNTL